MNIERHEVDELNAELVITIDPSDYSDRFEQSVKRYRKNLQLPGFRPGAVPATLVKKRFGKALLVEEISGVVQASLDQYIKDNKIGILGAPIPGQKELEGNWDSPDQFKFTYEIGLSPEFDINLSEIQGLTYYSLDITEETVDNEIQDYARRYGKIDRPEVSTEDSYLMVELAELNDDESVKEGGINSSSYVLIGSMDLSVRPSAVGLKIGDKLIVQASKLTESAADLGRMLNIPAESAEALQSKFELTVTLVSRLEPHALNEELFDKVYPGSEIKTLEEMKDKVRNALAAQFERYSNDRFNGDVLKELQNLVTVPLPENFLRRWIQANSQEPLTDEQIESTLAHYLQDIKRDLIIENLLKKFEVSVEFQEVWEYTTDQFEYANNSRGKQSDEKTLRSEVLQYLKEGENYMRMLRILQMQKLAPKLKENTPFTESKVPLQDFVELINS
jgi:trigger factor